MWLVFDNHIVPAISYPTLILPRNLDNDLGGLVKAGEEFDWERISFVLEATGFQPIVGSYLANAKRGLTPQKTSCSFCIGNFPKVLTILKRNNTFFLPAAPWWMPGEVHQRCAGRNEKCSIEELTGRLQLLGATTQSGSSLLWIRIDLEP